MKTWSAVYLFVFAYSVIIMIPCVMITIIGRKFFENLGRYPTKTPAIQVSLFWKLALIEIVTFVLLIGFYQIFV